MKQPDPRLSRAKAHSISEVAARLGVSDLRPAGRELVGPCPVCGGDQRRADRFSINDDMGVFNCRQCATGGDQISLVEFVLGVDFRGALQWLEGDLEAEIDPDTERKREFERKRRDRDKAERLRRDLARKHREAREIWDAARPIAGTWAEVYLRCRGIDLADLPAALRFHADLPYLKRGLDGRPAHSGPAMVAAITGADGRLRAVHITWLDPHTPGKKMDLVDRVPDWSAKLVRGQMKGGAIRLSSPVGAQWLIVGEGIETTLSAMVALTPAPIFKRAAFWCAVSLGNMSGRMDRATARPSLDDREAWIPPESIERLMLLADGDSDPEITQATLTACVRRARHHNGRLRGFITAAPDGGDFNDLVID